MASNFTRKLSRFGNLWQILKGFAVDTGRGGFPLVQPMKAVANGSNTAITAAITLDSEVVLKKSGGDVSNPDFPRALLVKGNQADCDGTVKIVGRDYSGESVVEEITASGSSAISGLKVFKSVDYVLFPVRSHSGQTLSIGTTNKLGLWRPISEAALDDLTVNGTSENATALDAVNNTFTPTTTPDGAKKFVAYYRTDIF